MGGNGDGTNPEQLFAAGYSACFLGALGLVARNQGVKLGEHSLDSEVDLIKDETSFHIGVRLTLNAPDLDRETATAALVARGTGARLVRRRSEWMDAGSVQVRVAISAGTLSGVTGCAGSTINTHLQSPGTAKAGRERGRNREQTSGRRNRWGQGPRKVTSISHASRDAEWITSSVASPGRR
jgi:hypothetical protein